MATAEFRFAPTAVEELHERLAHQGCDSAAVVVSQLEALDVDIERKRRGGSERMGVRPQDG